MKNYAVVHVNIQSVNGAANPGVLRVARGCQHNTGGCSRLPKNLEIIKTAPGAGFQYIQQVGFQ